MNITDIRIRRTFEESRLRALVSLTLEGDFAIHDIKVIDGPQRLFVAMPSRRDEQGVFSGYMPSYNSSGTQRAGRKNSERLQHLYEFGEANDTD